MRSTRFKMRLLVAILFIVTPVLGVHKCCHSGGYHYLNSTDSFYKVFPPTSNPYFACRAENAEYFYPLNQQEATEVFSYVIPKTVNLINIGVVKCGSTYLTSDGEDNFQKNFNLPPSSYGSRTINMNRNIMFSSSNSSNYFLCRKRQEEKCKTISNLDKYKVVAGLNSYLNFHNKDADYGDCAEMICASEGADLYYPSTPEEVKLVNNLLPNSVEEILIGIHNVVNGIWMSIDGDRSIMKTLGIEGKNQANQILSLDQKGNFPIHGLLDKKLPFICRKTVEDCSCRLEKTEYFYRNRKLYKFHAEKRNFIDAKTVCRCENGSLVHPSEMEVLWGAAGAGCTFKNGFWMGYKSALPYDDLVDIHDQVIALPQEVLHRPLYIDEFGGCGTSNNIRKLQLRDCDEKRPFFCVINDINHLLGHFVFHPKPHIYLATNRLPLRWNDARQLCRDRKGFLAMPTTKLEKDAVNIEMEKHNLQEMHAGFVRHSTQEAGVTLLGWNRLMKELSWVNVRESDLCGNIQKNWRITHKDCEMKLSFMCLRHSSVSGRTIGIDFNLGYYENSTNIYDEGSTEGYTTEKDVSTEHSDESTTESKEKFDVDLSINV